MSAAKLRGVALSYTLLAHSVSSWHIVEIHKETGCEVVEAWVLDLADFSSIKAFVARFEEEGGGRLDVLLENAAVSLPDLSFTKDGWETV